MHINVFPFLIINKVSTAAFCKLKKIFWTSTVIVHEITDRKTAANLISAVSGVRLPLYHGTVLLVIFPYEAVTLYLVHHAVPNPTQVSASEKQNQLNTFCSRSR